jgi:hypothetical protein
MGRFKTHLMEILTTPIGCLPASMSIKDGKETLPVDSIVIKHVRMSIFHCPSGPSLVLYAEPKSRVIR